MVCVLHECLGDYVPSSPRRNLPALSRLIASLAAAEIASLEDGDSHESVEKRRSHLII